MNWGGIQICPYFNSQASKRIKCESVGMSDEQKTAIEFGTEKEKKNWIQKYCENQQYHLCPYAQIISKKYGIYHENKGFIEIGYELRVIQKNRVYKREGYKSFESYTKKSLELAGQRQINI